MVLELNNDVAEKLDDQPGIDLNFAIGTYQCRRMLESALVVQFHMVDVYSDTSQKLLREATCFLQKGCIYPAKRFVHVDAIIRAGSFPFSRLEINLLRTTVQTLTQWFPEDINQESVAAVQEIIKISDARQY